jgi:hypothetical protein
MPIRTLLARIRRLVPSANDDRYEQIADGFAEETFNKLVSDISILNNRPVDAARFHYQRVGKSVVALIG